MVYYKQGLRRLARHKPHLALKAFHAAVSACPVKKGTQLARILYYTGVTLKKIGANDGAVRIWSVARKLRKSPPVLHYMRWFCNEYGMARQNFIDTDDWRAFYSIHLKRYLEMKESRCLGTPAEGDMIRDLIYDAWATLKTSICLEEMVFEEKLLAFQNAWIVFPVFQPAEGVRTENRQPSPGTMIRLPG
ncbi:MAG: hypothetical protein LBK13_01460 [Spirochaetales bacterium]|nr:hypothetical protein [Spirochaetales bacterium]